MTGNAIVKSQLKIKPNINLSSAVRNASCSRGWLRIVVQYIFGAITVASFVMIVLMSMKSTTTDPDTPAWCFEQNCRIICNGSGYGYEDDIFTIASAAEANCHRLSLLFKNLIFEDQTMPSQWLSRIRSRIYKVGIKGGNLRFISPHAFLSLFGGNIEILIFEGVSLSNWMSDTFVGLAQLSQLYIKNCTLSHKQQNILQAVDDTLQILTITDSDSWNPINITGSVTLPKLHTADLSFNFFDRVLRRKTFTGLGYCKILYLNSCQISAIGAGTFDPLLEIEIIYLNNNNLVTIPTGLFDGMLNRINPRPRINLQDNPWHCDCDLPDFTILHSNGLLYVDPTCHSPDGLRDQPFSAIADYCQNGTLKDVIVVNNTELLKVSSADIVENYSLLREDTTCAVNKYMSNSMINVKTIDHIDTCEKNISIFKYLISTGRLNHVTVDLTEGDWIKPSFMMKSYTHSMLQIVLTTDVYGVLWFDSKCPNEIYCISIIPKFLRVYDFYFHAKYIFCPIELRTGLVKIEKCVSYHLASLQANLEHRTSNKMVNMIFTGFICVVFGACLIYGIIIYNPILLKGSKRLLFVKHKNVDALVLPPKIPLRNYTSIQNSRLNFDLNNLPKDDNLSSFVRSKSIRSDKSSVSYISALQPTEDQLTEWRIAQHTGDNLTGKSMESELSIFSWVHNNNSCNYNECNIPYESRRQSRMTCLDPELF